MSRTAERVRYQKLPGHRRGFLRGSSLWLGPDHLLLVKSLRVREEYKRFHLRDIQAIVIAPATRFHFSTRAAGIGALWALLFLAKGSVPSWGAMVWGSAGICLAGIWAYVSWACSCRCQILTAVSREAVPSVYRSWTARQFLQAVEPRILELQGALPENWRETLVTLEARPTAPVAPDRGGVRELPEASPRLPLRRHSLAFDIFLASLFADAALNLATLHSITRTIQWVWYGLAFLEVACAIFIFVEHHRGILRAGMQKLAIATLIAMGAAYYMRQVMAGVTSASLSMFPDPSTLATLPAYILLRKVDVAVCLALGVAGLVLIVTGKSEPAQQSLTG